MNSVNSVNSDELQEMMEDIGAQLGTEKIDWQNQLSMDDLTEGEDGIVGGPFVDSPLSGISNSANDFSASPTPQLIKKDNIE